MQLPFSAYLLHLNHESLVRRRLRYILLYPKKETCGHSNWSICSQCTLSLPPENIRKLQGFCTGNEWVNFLIPFTPDSTTQKKWPKLHQMRNYCVLILPWVFRINISFSKLSFILPFKTICLIKKFWFGRSHVVTKFGCRKNHSSCAVFYKMFTLTS